MDIILTRDEYLKLRPNELNQMFVDNVRMILESNYDRERKFDEIQDKLKQYDRNKSKEENTLLWPAPQD